MLPTGDNEPVPTHLDQELNLEPGNLESTQTVTHMDQISNCTYAVHVTSHAMKGTYSSHMYFSYAPNKYYKQQNHKCQYHLLPTYIYFSNLSN